MEMIFDIGEDISFALNNDPPAPAQTVQPERATFLTFNLEHIIANAELSDLEGAPGKDDGYDFGKT